jgi:ribosomal protein S18 acetylase RimI-like enzyme
MPELVPVTLSPQEQAEFEQLSAGAPQPLNPIRDLNAQELFELATNDTSFDLASEFTNNKDLWGDPAIVQKTADAYHMIRERGFQLSDLPGPKKILGAVADIGKGFVKQAANYASAALSPIVGAAGELTGQGPGFQEEVAQNAQRKVAENISGTEASVSGIADMAARGAGKVARTLGLAKPLTAYTPEEKVKELFAATGSVEQQQQISQGKGAFLTPVGGEVVKELEGAGKPVRPEEVASLAPGDPLAWWTFGKALGSAGKLVPQPVKGAVAAAGEKVGEVATKAAGRSLQALGEATRIGAKTAGAVAPVVGAIKGGIEAGPLGVLAGTKVGEITKGVTQTGVKAGEAMSSVGKQMAGAAPLVSPVAQLGKDVIQSVPGVAGRGAEGLGMDIALSAVTSETPAETEAGVGLGAAIGLGQGALGAGRRVLSGQLIAPRAWGSPVVRPSSGQYPQLDAMHQAAYSSASRGQQERLNAIRGFVRGAAPDTDVFLASDPGTLQRALESSGVDSEAARVHAQQEGFFTTSLPGRDGRPRRVIVLRDADTAPHESFHAFQDVIGERANLAIDQIMRESYGDRWEAEGQRYADRLAGKPSQNWRDTLLDLSGWGHHAALEKVYRDTANRLRNEQGAEPNPADVEALVRAEWQGGRDAWRSILTPEEQAAVADQRIARELAAENFDAVFKNLGGALTDQQGALPKLARVVGKVVQAFGGEPLAGRTSEFGDVPLRTPAVEAVRDAVRDQQPPVIQPRGQPDRRPAPTPRTPPSDPSDAGEEARVIAESAPDVPVAGGLRSPRELLGEVAQAIASRSGIKINYLSAPGEPAASVAQNRTVRREVIEAFRSMPASARALWEKNFFPERVIKLKGDKYQVLGWAPEVFAANAHRMAQSLKGNESVSPYEISGDSFSEQGWRDLFADVETFVKNQTAGQTGAGEALVVPRNVADRGFFAPASRPDQAAPLNQRKADFINILFGYKLPDTPRIQKGKLPLNIAGQDVSAATKPGRVASPVEPRAPFSGEEAKRQGIEGREILEVNPLRGELQALLGDKYPSMIEAQQRLNLENIKEVQGAPEQPQFRGNTLTLTSGFQPKTAAGQKLVNDGFEYKLEGGFGNRRVALIKDGKEIAFVEAIGDNNDPEKARLDMVWVNPDFRKQGIGEALNREAGALMRDDGFSVIEATVVNPTEAKLINKVFPGTEFKPQFDRQGEPIPFPKSVSKISPASQFQPPSVSEWSNKLTSRDEASWKEAMEYQGKMGGGFTGYAYEIGAKVKTKEDLQALRSASDALSAMGREAMAAKDFTTAMDAISRAQAAREAYEAATGETLDGRTEATVPFIRKHIDPDFQPPMPGDAFKRWEKNQLDNGAEPATLSAEMSTQAQPKRNEDVANVADEYTGRAGINYRAPGGYANVPEDAAQRLADWYQKAKHSPDDPAVKAAYEALANETKDQYKSIVDAGYEIEAWTGEGEPYKNSAEMVKDVTDNKHLYFLKTEGNFEGAKSNHMLKPSGVNDWTVNDLFRAVHDFFGHAKEGLQFGPKGEFNAWREHSAMFSDEAQGALAAETLAQNFWVNFGEQVRGKNVALKDRPFAEQKNVVVPEETLNEIRAMVPAVAAAPKKKQKDPYRMPSKTGAGGFKKIWILPNGDVAQLGGTWHHEWLAENPEVAKKYGVEVGDFSGSDDFETRENALKKGFVRVNWGQNNGTLTIEGRARDWRKIKTAMQQLVEANLDDIDNVQVSLMSDDIKKTVDSDFVRLFNYDGAEKLDHLPFSENEPRGVGVRSDFKAAAQPKTALEEDAATDLFGRKEVLTGKQVNDMTRDELKRHFPEAIVPKVRDEGIPSEITSSPLYKRSENPVEAFGDKLVEFADQNKGRPEFEAGKKWYSEFVPRLKKEFGEDAQLMAELLAATSPQTNVETNYAYALDALESMKSGRFSKIITKFEEGMEMIENGGWRNWINREIKKGNVPNPPAEPTAATFLAHWIEKNKLKPTQSNGKLYGQHSIPVLQVFARRWLSDARGPKTLNFVQNLLGIGHEATIDLWADRTMRRLGYADSVERWRILPQNVQGVSDADFAFAQKAFRHAAQKLGIEPDALQGALWFAEKQLWAENGWSRLDLGDFRKEIEKTPLLKAGIKHRLDKTKARGKVKGEQEQLLIEKR